MAKSLSWVLLASSVAACSGFSPQPHGLSAAAAAAPSHRSVSSLCCGGASGISMSLNRRSLLSGLPSAAFLLAPLAPPSPALAQGNYVPTDGYELAPIVKNGKPSPVLLVPVVKALRTLEKIQDSFGRAPSTDATTAADSLRKADSSLSAAPFVPAKELKRVLNAYSDNIYTDDTSRRNMYLDGSAMLGQGKTTFGFGTFSAGPGGAVPLPGESMTYLYRNEVLDSVDALQAEVKYLIKKSDKGEPESDEDARGYVAKAVESLRSYLKSLPEGDVAEAIKYVSGKGGGV